MLWCESWFLNHNSLKNLINHNCCQLQYWPKFKSTVSSGFFTASVHSLLMYLFLTVCLPHVSFCSNVFEVTNSGGSCMLVIGALWLIIHNCVWHLAKDVKWILFCPFAMSPWEQQTWFSQSDLQREKFNLPFCSCFLNTASEWCLWVS